MDKLLLASTILQEPPWLELDSEFNIKSPKVYPTAEQHLALLKLYCQFAQIVPSSWGQPGDSGEFLTDYRQKAQTECAELQAKMKQLLAEMAKDQL